MDQARCLTIQCILGFWPLRRHTHPGTLRPRTTRLCQCYRSRLKDCLKHTWLTHTQVPKKACGRVLARARLSYKAATFASTSPKPHLRHHALPPAALPSSALLCGSSCRRCWFDLDNLKSIMFHSDGHQASRQRPHVTQHQHPEFASRNDN